jgi:hypothetical protein
MVMTSISKTLFGGLFLGIFVLSIVTPVFPLQAALGTVCTDASACGGYACVKAAGAANGACSGPCNKDTAVTGCQTQVGTQAGWAASVCTAAKDKDNTTNGTCIEVPAYSLKEGLTEGTQLLNIINIATNWVFAIFVVVSIIFVLLAAFQFVTGGGDTKKIEEARQKLIWATVGIVVALLAKGLVPVMRNIVGG